MGKVQFGKNLLQREIRNLDIYIINTLPGMFFLPMGKWTIARFLNQENAIIKILDYPSTEITQFILFLHLKVCCKYRNTTFKRFLIKIIVIQVINQMNKAMERRRPGTAWMYHLLKMAHMFLNKLPRLIVFPVRTENISKKR